jgi:hypothetical protein
MPKAIRTAFLLAGLALTCAPIIIYALDSLVGLGGLDPLAVSMLTGTLGAGFLALSQGDRWVRFFGALCAGLILVALQIYGIAFLVLTNSDL